VHPSFIFLSVADFKWVAPDSIMARDKHSQSAATGEIPAVELSFALNGRNADSGTLAATIFSKDGFGVKPQEVNPNVLDYFTTTAGGGV
jgi:hypothetical protein